MINLKMLLEIKNISKILLSSGLLTLKLVEVSLFKSFLVMESVVELKLIFLRL
jgi:hypothetical protein